MLHDRSPQDLSSSLPSSQVTSLVDRLSPERRSWLMSRVPSKHTGPELRVRSALHKMGLRFRLHRKDLPGSPDIVLPARRLAVFVHGCFWHRHPNCPKASTPKLRTEFWEEKFRRNVVRDHAKKEELELLGWRCEVIWECETKNQTVLLDRLLQLVGRDRS